VVTRVGCRRGALCRLTEQRSPSILRIFFLFFLFSRACLSRPHSLRRSKPQVSHTVPSVFLLYAIFTASQQPPYSRRAFSPTALFNSLFFCGASRVFPFRFSLLKPKRGSGCQIGNHMLRFFMPLARILSLSLSLSLVMCEVFPTCPLLIPLGKI